MSKALFNIIEEEMISVEGDKLTPHRGRTNELIGQVGRMQVIDQETYARGGDLVKILQTDLKKLDESRKETTQKPRDYVSWVNEEFKKITDPLNAAVAAAKKKMKFWAVAEEDRRKKIAKEAQDKADAEALVLAEKAENERKAAEEREREAAEEKRLAEEAGNAEAAEKAAKAEAEAAQEASEHQEKADEVLDAAANAPVVDTTVRKARGSFGATSGMRKVWKCEVVDLHEFMTEADAYLASLVANDPGVLDAVRKAVQKPAIARYRATNTEIPGLRVTLESEVSVR